MRYFIGLLSIVAFVLAVALLVVRGITGGGEPKDKINLADYANTDTVMRLTIDGEINSEQEHRAVRITIGRDEARMDILNGYNQYVANTFNFPNTSAGYETFLRALQLLGYTKGDDDPNLKDERGYCPSGNRYVFEVRENGWEAQRFWRSSCKEGNFGGDTTRVIDLFQRQIPDYNSLLGDVRL